MFMRETNKFLLRIADYHIKNMNGQDASQEEVYALWSFMNMLTSAKCKSLYARGESDANLQKHYCADTSSLEVLLNTIFCIGEKGRICLEDSDWIDPDDTTIRNFTKIYKLLNSAIKSAGKGRQGRVKKMQVFISRNQAFADAFLANNENLIKRYDKLCVEKRKMVNLYYLAILHTINSYS